MDIEAILVEAERILQTGDYDAAERVLTAYWPDPTTAPAEALHTMALIRLNQNRPAETEQLLRKAVELEPQSLRHNIALGHFLLEQNDDAGATDVYAAAMRIDRTWPELSTTYARAAYRSGRHDEAEKAARYAIELAPSAVAFDVLSCALRAKGKAKDALAAADEALRLAPQNPGAQHSRGAALLDLGKANEALAVFDSMLSTGADGPALRLGRGKALRSLKRDREAAEAFAEGARRFPNDRDLQAAARA